MHYFSWTILTSSSLPTSQIHSDTFCFNWLVNSLPGSIISALDNGAIVACCILVNIDMDTQKCIIFACSSLQGRSGKSTKNGIDSNRGAINQAYKSISIVLYLLKIIVSDNSICHAVHLSILHNLHGIGFFIRIMIKP